jgi:excinuclease ABC subunit C
VSGNAEDRTQGFWRHTVSGLAPQEEQDRAEAQAKADAREHGQKPGFNKNGEPLLGDSRDLFRPNTSDIPTSPGVYKWRDANGRVIYVGKAKNLRNRLTFYFQPLNMLHPRTQAMVLTGRSLEWTVVGTEMEALTLEYTWIKEFDPHFNVVFRDDKTYPFLAVSFGEKYPRIWITRSKRTRKTRYFGPYTKVWGIKNSLDKLLSVFPVRTCAPTVFHRAHVSGRPCLLYSIGKCSGPCIGKVSPEKHREMVNQLTSILTGRVGIRYIRQLTDQMKAASDALDFEKAARLRDEIAAMKNAVEQNSVIFSDDVNADFFGFAGDELEASVHAFFVRSGTIRGERDWSVEKVEDISDSSLMADMITQVYSQLEEDEQRESDAEPDAGSLPTSSAPSVSGGIDVTTKRDAVSSAESLTASNALERAAATRERKKRESMTGRDDLFSQASPIPPEIIVPIMPDDSSKLEEWLSGLRGSRVTIHVAQRGDKKSLMDRAQANAALSLKQNKMKRTADIAARQQAMNDIKDQLGLSRSPLRIEGYDVSNAAGGGYQVASMVVFEDGMARPSEYRRFSIRGRTPTGHTLDDLDALYETMTRRFRHGNIAGDSGDSDEAEHKIQEMEKTEKKIRSTVGAAEDEKTTVVSEEGIHQEAEQIVQQGTNARRFAYKPNLIVVDGGAGQVAAVQKALDDCHITDVAVCGLAKRLEEVWLPGEDYPLILKRQSQGMYLLQRVRDESHRFAITYHRNRRRKGQLNSVVDSIPGIGPQYRKRLLNHFGSVKKLTAATVDEIEAVKGIGHTRAQQIYTALHPVKEDQQKDRLKTRSTR